MATADGPLLQHLPAIYSAWDDGSHLKAGEKPALRILLAAFEDVLFGPDGLEQQIARLDHLFTPEQTPSEFLTWLAQWVALSQYRHLPQARLRKLIANIVPLYSYRGTKRYLEQLLDYFIPENTEVAINDRVFSGLTVGSSRVGLDAWLGVDRPFWFRVTLRARVDSSDPVELADLKQKLEDTVRPVIDLAKPAHTTYQLLVEFEGLSAEYA